MSAVLLIGVNSSSRDVSTAAKIRGGLALLVIPVLVAVLLVAAVEVADLGRSWWRRGLLAVAALSTAPGLWFGCIGLVRFHHDGDRISKAQYAAVSLGDRRSAVRHLLGRPEPAEREWFVPAAAGLACDFYFENDHTETEPFPDLRYRLCYRDNRLVSKDASRQIPR